MLRYLFFLLIVLLGFNQVNAETRTRPWIGIEFTDVTDEFIKLNELNINTPKNIVITGVVKDSGADEANIVPGDVVISINNKVTKVKQDLIDILKTKYANDILNVKIYRKGNTIAKKVKLKTFPDPGFKPKWITGSKKLKIPKIAQYGLEKTLISNKDALVFQKYFSKKVVKIYNQDNPIVVCVVKGSSNKKLKLYDQIISVNGERLGKSLLTEKPVQVKISRNGKILNKVITPTSFDLSNVRHNCTPEYLEFDCLVDWDETLKLEKKNRGNGWRKLLKCIEKAPIVPFSNVFMGKEGSKINIKLDTTRLLLGYLQYDASDLKSKDSLNEINKVLVIANAQLKEFDQFQKLYPDHAMAKSYNGLLNAVVRAASWAGGTHSDKFKSQKDKVIKADKETIERTKLALEKIIKKKKINSPEAIKFLTSKKTYFHRAGEIEYLIEKYSEAKNSIEWNKDNLDKYFDDVYEILAGFYFENSEPKKAIELTNEGLEIAYKNYENLYFKSAVADLLISKYTFDLSYSPITFFENIKELSKLAKKHLLNLESLSEEDKSKMLKIDKYYHLDILALLYNLTMLDSVNKNFAYYPLKSLNYIKSHKELNYQINYPLSLVSLLQGSVLDDDIKNFMYAKNEMDILFSTSAGNYNKLRSLLTIASPLLQTYNQIGFYSESDEYVNFLESTFDLDKILNNPAQRMGFILFQYYAGQSAIRNDDIKKAKKTYEAVLNLSNVSKSIEPKNIETSDLVVISRFIPDLMEIYFDEKNYKKLNQLNEIYFNKGIVDISKKDLKNLYDVLDLNQYKILKIQSRYLQKNNNKKIKIIAKHLKKSVENHIKILKSKNQIPFFNAATSKVAVLSEIAETAKILIENNFKMEGVDILNKIYPIIMDDYNLKSSRSVWKPNIDDNVFGSVYLDIAENYLPKDKAFLKRAHSIAQAGKNLFTSRDLSKAIAKKSFKDPNGLIEKYENIKRELSVNLRSKQFAPKEVVDNSKISEELNNRNRKLQNELVKLEKDIKIKIPVYFKLTKFQTAEISELQSLLDNDEVLLDYYFYEKDLKVVLITKDKFEILSNKTDLKKLNQLNKQVRNTLIPSNGTIKPYAVNKSFDMNEQTFLFLNKVTSNYKNIIVIPDGPLNSMPLHALAYAKNKDCLDCRNVQFNLNNHNFNYFPSVETFISIDTVAEEFKAIRLNISNKKIKKAAETIVDLGKQKTGVKLFKKLKEIASKKDKSESSKLVKKTNTDLFYLGLGDPDLYSQKQIEKIDTTKKITMLRSLFDKDTVDSDLIRKIYGPVDGSADEINQVAKYLSPLKSKILLRKDATEINLKELDLSSYKIIHFATHGEISGALEGFNEPFLVLSPPSGSSTEDGLLTMSEIMSLNTNANLVVLSACNTASGDEIGSEGFSGLAKSFFMSGSKSILVSNWYIETYSAKELVINLFKNLKNNPNSRISSALSTTMLDMVKNQKDRSHPIFWAPFVIVGKDSRLTFNK